MSEKIDEVANELVRIISEEGKEEAKEYCKESIESDIEPDSDEYEDTKSQAIDETEVWGDESSMWLEILPASASDEETDSEWRFVSGNFLLSSVMECKTDGSVTDDALISKAAHEMFEELHKSKRHEMLSLSIYHHKMGHVGMLENDYDTAIENFENALSIIENHDSLGGWHHHCLILRDIAKAEAESEESEGNLIEAADHLKSRRKDIQETGSPTKEKFSKQLEAEEHRIRAEMADQIGNTKRRRKHLRKCSRLYEQSGKEDLAEKYSRIEMQVNE